MRRLWHTSSRFCSSLSAYTTRTHTCAELSLKNAGETVTLSGWLEYKRMNKFMVLRDAYGTVQTKVPDHLCETLKTTPYESVVQVSGTVRDRGKDRNQKMKTGEIEIEVTKLEVLNAAPKVLPLRIDEENSERTRLKYRYLDIRSSRMQKALRLRSELVHSMRKFLLEKRGFVDVETPTLFRRTPGGAAEFQVPAPKPNQGKCYSLPQSPQQFKQLLMVGGIDRYFQIARCYRDEGSKLDRQPEFTQVDLELSFTTQEGVMSLLEDLIVESWPEQLKELRPIAPFTRMTYADAMRCYGVDKPDLRIPWKLKECTELLIPIRPADATVWSASVIICKGMARTVSNSNRKEWKRLIEMNSLGTPMAIFTGSKTSWFKNIDTNMLKERLKVDESDAVVFSWGQPDGVQYTLGQMRNLIGEAGGLRKGKEIKFSWIVDFPLFVVEDGILCSAHHPFTAPLKGQEEWIYNSERVMDVRGQHYDLVLNGVELGGGSIRIHNGHLQEYVLKDVLGEDPTELAHLIEALKMGAPPHGGFAIGLDRMVALLLGEGDTSVGVREVIAFPKSKDGRDLMSGAPCEPTKLQMDKYGMEFKFPEETEALKENQ